MSKNRNALSILHWYTDAREFTLHSNGPVVEVPSVRSLELDLALDQLVDGLIRFASEHRWMEQLFGLEEVDLLEAGRILLFASLKSNFRLWWAWQLLAESGNAHAVRIPCGDPPLPDALELTKQGRELGFEPVLEPSSAIQVEMDDKPLPWRERLQSRLRWLRKRYRAALPPVKVPTSEAHQRILYTNFYPNSTATLVPLYQALASQHGVDQLYIAARPKVGHALKKVKVPSYDIYRCSSPKIREADARVEQISEALRPLLQEWWQAGWPSDWLPPTSSLRDKVALQLDHVLNRGRWLASRYRHILTRFQPTCVVVSTDASIEARTLELHAQQDGIRTICIQHGLYNHTSQLAYFIADYTCVWGPHHARVLEAYPGSGGQIIVTGSPKHERLKRQYDLNSSPRLDTRTKILYAATMIDKSPGLSPQIYYLTLKEIIIAANKMPECDFIIKLHPADRLEPAVQYCSNHITQDNVRIIQHENVYKLIRDSDVVIVVSSTVGYEALLWEKPLVILNLTNEPDWLPFVKDGSAVGVYQRGQLEAALLRSLSEPLSHRSFEQYWRVDGYAVDRCRELILNQHARQSKRG